MDDTTYHYNAHVDSVYDGDTITVTLDLGLKIKIKEKLRLSRINTPEIRGDEREDGLVARDRLRELILGKDIIVQTTKDKKGKYGRYIADIWLKSEELAPYPSDPWVNINDLLVEESLAEYVQY